ncbi:Tat pathway signal protein [Streptomyces sp. NA04227]|uniref:Tat pathway signal protein n=1 Tax=Streptomyces sp. NA04227 TaxID=2742136 RepID=UPI001592753B|nr:Tat pathway signal protein [Streptomyces sp. NA04227]QKW08110.1 Tat pathway signal protein [Streptomyces sp. NA04227]
MARTRSRNRKLAALIKEAHWSQAQLAAALVRVAMEHGAREFAGVGRSHVSHWVRGTQPSGRAPELLCESLSRRLGRTVTTEDAGFSRSPGSRGIVVDWHTDTLTALADLGGADLDMERRQVLSTATYSVTALALPGAAWWQSKARQDGREKSATRGVGRGEVDSVRDMVSLFSRMDQRHGGGHARTAAVQYLTSDVAGYLKGRFATDRVRREMFSAAGELAYVSGWMAFDNSEHAIAQRYFVLAVKLAAEADDGPMAGHVLRAMAHQAVDLGQPRSALDLASASMAGERYSTAAPRERALLGVVHARSLAAVGESSAAAAALVRAEDDLAAARPGDEEPERVFFFQEASLAHETACTLRDCGDLDGALRQFSRSARTRKTSTFTRTHAVTLGYLGQVQIRQGNLEEACGSWAQALDSMDGVRSGRTRRTAQEMRAALSPFRKRGVRVATEIDARARAYLETAGSR